MTKMFCCDKHGSRRPYATFAEAEKLARSRYKKVGHGAIYTTIEGRGGPRLATIAKDGLGRIWTDLTNEGATYA